MDGMLQDSWARRLLGGRQPARSQAPSPGPRAGTDTPRRRGPDLPSGLRRLVGDPDPGINDPRRRGPEGVTASGGRTWARERERALRSARDAEQSMADARRSGAQTPSGTQTPSGPQRVSYSATLPALTADEDMAFNLQAEQAMRARRRSDIGRSEELGRLGVWATQADTRALREGYQSGRSLRDQLSGSGLGFSPMFVNRGMRDISSSVAAQRADVQAQRATREEALSRSAREAEDSYNEALSRIEIEKAMRRSGRAGQRLGA